MYNISVIRKKLIHSRFVLHSITTAAYGREINYESRIKWNVWLSILRLLPRKGASLSRQVRYHFDFVGGGNTIIEEPK